MRKLLLSWVFLLLIVCPADVLSAEQDSSEKDYRNLELFTDVFALIQSSYVEEADSQELIYGAVRGMLETLDPHSSFMTPEMYEDMQADTHGEFGGLGIEIAIKDRDLMVVAPIEGTPADRAGIKAGDRIVRINDQTTDTLEIMSAVRLMRGPVGEAVDLEIAREGESDLLPFTIVRDLIQIESIKSRMVDEGFGYIRISQFQERTGSDLREHLAQLQAAADKPLAGLILDLRNNPGGLLDQAVSVSDLFLDEGLIVYTKGRDPEAQLEFKATAEDKGPDCPLVVLINGGSASASEIVAGALQDHGRAVIVGEQSFGKGSVQTIVPLGDDSGLRLTTSRYFTPSGRSIQARGIAPDINVTQVAEPHPELTRMMREKDLENHIEASPGASQKSTAEGTKAALPVEDLQLQRAVELLQSYTILRQADNS